MPQQHAAHYQATDRLQEQLIQVYRLYNSELASMKLAVSTQSLDGRHLLNLSLSRLYQTLFSNQSDAFILSMSGSSCLKFAVTEYPHLLVFVII